MFRYGSELEIPDLPDYIIVYDGPASHPVNIKIMNRRLRKPRKSWGFNSYLCSPTHNIWRKADGELGYTLYGNKVLEYIKSRSFFCKDCGGDAGTRCDAACPAMRYPSVPSTPPQPLT